MSIIYEALKGLILISILAYLGNGCSIEDMAKKAFDSNKNGIKYLEYSKALTQ